MGMTEMHDPERGTGRTSRQLRFAPHGAVFVWCNDVLDYPKTLAKAHWIDRPDLVIIGPSQIRDRVRGRVDFVVDHAARLTADQIETIRHRQKKKTA